MTLKNNLFKYFFTFAFRIKWSGQTKVISLCAIKQKRMVYFYLYVKSVIVFMRIWWLKTFSREFVTFQFIRFTQFVQSANVLFFLLCNLFMNVDISVIYISSALSLEICFYNIFKYTTVVTFKISVYKVSLRDRSSHWIRCTECEHN